MIFSDFGWWPAIGRPPAEKAVFSTLDFRSENWFIIDFNVSGKGKHDPLHFQQDRIYDFILLFDQNKKS